MGVENPKISIVLPVYNGAKHLRDAIDSCLHQTYPNIELIVVDDCSTDETPQIVKSYRDDRIKYIRNRTNQRLPKSLNIGFAQSTGDYLTWTSDDNQFVPEAIGEMLQYLLDNPSVDFVYTDNLSKYLDTGETKKRTISGPENIKGKNCIGACYLYKRKVYETVGDFNPYYELVEDYEYWVRVWKKFRMHYLPKTLYIYGEHSQSLTSKRMLSVQLFDKIMKYRHRFISTHEFVQDLIKFLVVSIDCRESLHQLVALWVKTVRSLFGISVLLGLFFVLLAVYTFTAKMFGLAVKKCLWPLRKYRAESNIRQIISGLEFSQQKTNILCVVQTLAMGGAQKVAYEIASGLKQQTDFDFHLVTVKHKNESLKEVFSKAFKNIITISRLTDEKLYQLYFSAVIKTLNIKILLISHSNIVYLCLPGLKKEFPKLKVIDILHLERVGPTRNEMLWANPYIDKRVCISNGIRQHMISKLGSENGKADRFTRIYNGIDLDHYKDDTSLKGLFKAEHKIPQHVRLVTFVGRFSEEKNPLLFVDIARDVLKANPNLPVKFVMAGDGNLWEQTRQKVKTESLSENVILTGVISNIRELIADTYVLVFVSDNEGIPLTVTEALAMNIPVVSTIVGAVDEVVEDDVNGYLIPRNGKVREETCIKLTALLRDEVLHKKLSQNARASVLDKFSREHMCQQYRELFEQQLSRL